MSETIQIGGYAYQMDPAALRGSVKTLRDPQTEELGLAELVQWCTMTIGAHAHWADLAEIDILALTLDDYQTLLQWVTDNIYPLPSRG